MTCPDIVAGPAPGPPATRLLAVAVAVAVAVPLLTWLAAVAVPAHPAVVAAGTPLAVPGTGEPAVRMRAPAGWTETTGPADHGVEYTRGTDTLSIDAAAGVADLTGYARRQVRLAAALAAVRGTPDGAVRGGDGLAGPRFRITGPDGRGGELVVLGRGRTAVAVRALGDPARPVDLGPLLDSIRVNGGAS